MRFATRSAPPASTADEVPGDEPLTLPSAWTPPPRPPVPVVASIVPVVGAVGLWLVTGSVLSLWLAVLGPLIAVATMADGARSARRDRRRHRADAARIRGEVTRAVSARHELERRRAWTLHPDVASFLSRDGEIWRSSAGRADALVVGEGDVPSAVRVTGGEGDADAASLRARAARLSHAPVVASATQGVVVVGGDVVAAGVQRALAVQLCLAIPPGELAIVGPLRDELAWAERLPHRAVGGPRRLALVGPGDPVPPDADVAIARRAPGEPLPPQCAAILTVRSPDAATIEHGGESTPVRVESLAHAQAVAIAAELAERAELTLGIRIRDSGPIALGPLVEAGAERGTLGAVIGLAGNEPAIVDLVADGPHAVVAGITGSGKSELLITWILSLCGGHSTREVNFLLADFKGGTAFDALAAVPHVTGVITDLDGAGARRAIESLRAEVRRREAAIAGAGARDILDPRVDLPRLVIVVDEFAALLGDHPELHAVFADVAARGRALGIHLVLGTQRAAGVIRDGLLANCPLRVSLRVTDAADSRTVLGTDDAALLPGGPAGRGFAYVRGAGDAQPRPVRIALSDASDVAAAIARAGDGEPRRPWLPALPSRVSLAELRMRAPGADEILLGLADEPDRQRQRVVGVRAADRALLVLGGPGSGATNTLALVAAQVATETIRVPADAEGMWDAVAALAAESPPPGTVVCIDDLDAITGRLPADHAQVLLERLEELLRRAGTDGILVVAGAHRLSGAVSRLAELFPRRLLLPFPTRAEHLGAGGDPSAFDDGAQPGRGTMDGSTLQVGLAPHLPTVLAPSSPQWHPSGRLTGFVTRRSPAARTAIADWEGRGIRSVAVDDYAADASIVAESPVVIVGEPDDWQRHWRLLADVRGDHDLVIDSSCAQEFRLLTGSRTLAPYCEAGRGRAWLVSAGGEAVRIVLPSAQVRPNRRPGHP